MRDLGTLGKFFVKTLNMFPVIATIQPSCVIFLWFSNYKVHTSLYWSKNP